MSTKTGLTVAFQIADALHVQAASAKHRAEMHKLGVTEAELKAFGVAIVECQKIVDLGPPSDAANLEETRAEMKDLLGLYRRTAAIVANTFVGRNAALEKQLRLGQEFPVSDVTLKHYVTGLSKVVKKHAAQLGTRGMSKEQQGQLDGLIARYLNLLAARARQRGNARAVRASRDAAFEVLRTQTRYLRLIGRSALVNSAAQSDFDRVKPAPKQGKKAAPAQAGQGAAAQKSIVAA